MAMHVSWIRLWPLIWHQQNLLALIAATLPTKFISCWILWMVGVIWCKNPYSLLQLLLHTVPSHGHGNWWQRQTGHSDDYSSHIWPQLHSWESGLLHLIYRSLFLLTPSPQWFIFFTWVNFGRLISPLIGKTMSDFVSIGCCSISLQLLHMPVYIIGQEIISSLLATSNFNHPLLWLPMTQPYSKQLHPQTVHGSTGPSDTL